MNSRRDNSNIMEDIVDLKSTINLNWKVFADYIMNNNNESNDEEVKTLLDSCKKLIDENITCASDIRKLKEKIISQSNIIDTLPEKLNNEYNEEKKRYAKLQNVIASKKNTYSKLTQELERMRSKAIFKSAKREILITEPNRINVEMNHEIQTTQNILRKITELNKRDKERIEDLNQELSELQNKMKKLQSRYYNHHSKTLSEELPKRNKLNTD